MEIEVLFSYMDSNYSNSSDEKIFSYIFASF